jgi:hypothetical protein
MCIDPEIAKTDIQFFASPHGRRPKRPATPPIRQDCAQPAATARQRAVIRRHRARARAPAPSTATPGGDGSPSGQTGAAAARGEARTLTALLRLRPGGRRYVHPRRRATPSLSQQPGHPSRPAGDPARIYYCSASSLSSPSSRARRAANSATCRSTRRRPSISSWRPSVIWASSPAIRTPCSPTV